MKYLFTSFVRRLRQKLCNNDDSISKQRVWSEIYDSKNVNKIKIQKIISVLAGLRKE
jgi:hypothetical protein